MAAISPQASYNVASTMHATIDLSCSSSTTWDTPYPSVRTSLSSLCFLQSTSQCTSQTSLLPDAGTSIGSGGGGRAARREEGVFLHLEEVLFNRKQASNWLWLAMCSPSAPLVGSSVRHLFAYYYS